MEPSDVRDLEQEGVLGHINLTQSWSAGVQDAFGNAARDMRIHALQARIERLEEVVRTSLKNKEANMNDLELTLRIGIVAWVLTVVWLAWPTIRNWKA